MRARSRFLFFFFTSSEKRERVLRCGESRFSDTESAVFVSQQLLIADQANNCYPRKWCARTFSINDLAMQSGGAIVAAFQCIGFSVTVSAIEKLRH